MPPWIQLSSECSRKAPNSRFASQVRMRGSVRKRPSNSTGLLSIPLIRTSVFIGWWPVTSPASAFCESRPREMAIAIATRSPRAFRKQWNGRRARLISQRCSKKTRITSSARCSPQSQWSKSCTCPRFPPDLSPTPARKCMSPCRA